MCGIGRNRERPGPLKIECDVDFPSLCRMGVDFIYIVYLTRTRASLVSALRHTSTAATPSLFLQVCLHKASANKPQNVLKVQIAQRHFTLP